MKNLRGFGATPTPPGLLDGNLEADSYLPDPQNEFSTHKEQVFGATLLLG